MTANSVADCAKRKVQIEARGLHPRTIRKWRRPEAVAATPPL